MSNPEAIPPDNAKPPEELPPTELEKLVGRARPWAAKYGLAVVGAAVGLLVLVTVVTTLASGGGDPSAWADFHTAASGQGGSAAALDAVAAEHAGTDAAVIARLVAAESLLSTGVEALFTDRQAGLQDLGEARERFEGLLADSLPADLAARATYGLASTLESSAESETDIEKAASIYERLVTTYPDSAYSALAGDRATDLGRGDAAEFYAWFAAQNPQPATIDTPDDVGGAGSGTTNDSPFGSSDFGDLIEGIDDLGPTESPAAASGTGDFEAEAGSAAE